MTQSHKSALEAALFLLKFLEDHGHPARFVGGCVRDRLLGIEPKDYDIGTPLKPKACIELLEKNGIKVIPTGIDYGTVTALIDGYPIEMTTLREDVSTDGRRAVVKFGESFEVDAARRDFTINSLSEDARGQVYDYYGGRTHLREKKLIFVGDPETRIKEDYLRLLRLYRFYARLGFSFDEALEPLIEKNKEGLSHVSQERITGELEEILSSPYTYRSLVSMHRTGVLKLLFPFSSEEALASLVSYCKSFKEFDPSLLHLFPLGALFYFSLSSENSPSFEKVNGIGKSLKLSNQLIKRIDILIRGFSRSKEGFKDQAELLLFAKECDRGDHEEFFRDVGTPFWFHLASFHESEKKQIKVRLEKNLLLYSKKRDLLTRPLPLSAKEVMKLLGLKEGAALGKALDEMKRSFLNEKAQTKDEMRAHLRAQFSK